MESNPTQHLIPRHAVGVQSIGGVGSPSHVALTEPASVQQLIQSAVAEPLPAHHDADRGSEMADAIERPAPLLLAEWPQRG